MLPTHNLGTSLPKYRISLYHICNCVPGLVFAISKYILRLHGESFKLNIFDFILGLVQFMLYLLGRYESSPPPTLRWFLATDWRPWTRTLRVWTRTPQPEVSNRMHPGVVPDVVTLPIPSPSRGSSPPGFPIHSPLDGVNLQHEPTFNLASPHYAPMQIMQNQPIPTNLRVRPLAEKRLPTYPPIRHLRIVSDDLPQGPILFEYNLETYRERTGVMLVSPPQISSRDAPSGVYRELHVIRGSHIDWARLNGNRNRAVARRAFEALWANLLAQFLRNTAVKNIFRLLF